VRVICSLIDQYQLRRSRIQQRVDLRLKFFIGARPTKTLAVEGECWCGRNTKLMGDIRLVFDQLGILSRIQAAVECLGIQSQIGCKRLEIILGKGTLVFSTLMSEKVIMIIPVFILVVGTLGSFSGPL